jgi:hypothetical protein
MQPCFQATKRPRASGSSREPSADSTDMKKDGSMSKPSTETLSVVVEREVPFPPEKVWRVLTQPPLIEKWLTKNDFKPVVDHAFTLRADWGAVDCKVWQSSRTKRCLTRGRPMVWRVSSLGLSTRRAREPACAWSSRGSGRISRSTMRALRAGGSGSLRPWSRSWRGSIEVEERR